MKSTWKQYRLGDFLKRQYESVSVDNTSEYKRITIKTKGQGIELRDVASGLDIGTKNQFRVKANQFLLSKIDALNGAFGIVPLQCDGGIITGNFWTYDINDTVITKEYLGWLCFNQVFSQFSLKASEGTTNRKYLREDKFLDLTINLPEIGEQDEIVERVQRVKERIDEIKDLRKKQQIQIRNLLYSKYIDLIKDVEWLPMNRVAPIVRRDVQIHENESYPELGIRSFGKGTFHKAAITGLEVGTKKLYRIQQGDLMFSNVFAWEGAIAVAKEEDEGRFGSHRFISCLCDDEKAVPEFLCFHFLTEKGLEDINKASPGGAGRNKTLGLDKLMNISVPAPEVSLQIEFANFLNKIKKISEHHQEVLINQDGVLPGMLENAFNGKL